MLLDEQILLKERKKLENAAQTFVDESRKFSLLADPTRLKILHLLRNHEELCVNDLASILQLTSSDISHQLAMLERAGEVQKTKRGKIVCYALFPTKQHSKHPDA